MYNFSENHTAKPFGFQSGSIPFLGENLTVIDEPDSNIVGIHREIIDHKTVRHCRFSRTRPAYLTPEQLLAKIIATAHHFQALSGGYLIPELYSSHLHRFS